MDAASQKSTSNAHKSNNINRPCPDAFKVYTSQIKAAFIDNDYQRVYYSRRFFDDNSSLETGKYSVIDINFEAANLLENGKPEIPIEGELH